jgi:hypothetical protein
MVNKTANPIASYKHFLVMFVSVPGFVFLLLGWLAIAVTILYAALIQTSMVDTTSAQKPAQPLFVLGEITPAQSVIMMIMTLAIWFGIAVVVRRVVTFLAKRFNEPHKARNVITFGGVVLGWGTVATASLVSGIGQAMVIFSLIVGVVAALSFMFEQLLARTWRIKLI